MQIAVEYVWLLGLVTLLSISRWHYWRGCYETLYEARDWEASALRKRLKANGRLISGLESQTQQWQVWARSMVQNLTTDECDAERENEPEQPTDGG